MFYRHLLNSLSNAAASQLAVFGQAVARGRIPKAPSSHQLCRGRFARGLCSQRVVAGAFGVCEYNLN